MIRITMHNFIDIIFFSSTSDNSNAFAPQTCGLATIPEGFSEDRESPIVDIEDILDGFKPHASENNV